MRSMTFTWAGIAVLTMAACTPGQSEFSCQGYPDGVSCLSARKVYELTNSRSRVTQQEVEGIGYARRARSSAMCCDLCRARTPASV